MKKDLNCEKFSRKSGLKLLRAALAIGFAVTVLLQAAQLSAACDGIRDSVLRMHILANSDSAEDQTLKLRIRDRLLTEGKLYLGGACDRQEAAALAAGNLEALGAAAREEIAAAGYSYDVTVSLGDAYFDTRVYDSVTLPAGNYEALRVVIGSGQGRNWWCVMFPPMCVSAASEVASDEEALEGVLTGKETDFVENGGKYRVKFKLVEYYEEAKQAINRWRGQE